MVADHADLRDVEQLLADLPRDAYGQVFLTVPTATSVMVAAPPRVAVCLLPGDEPASGLCAALTGWASEWLPDEPWLDPRPVTWVGRVAGEHLRGADAFPPGAGVAVLPAAEGEPAGLVLRVAES